MIYVFCYWCLICCSQKIVYSKHTQETSNVLTELKEIANNGAFVYSTRSMWNTVKDSTGYPLLLNFEDLNDITGVYWNLQQYKNRRKRITNELIQRYKLYGTITVFTWHLENPYTPRAWKDAYYGENPYRYRYKSNGYPQKHRYVINEILNNIGDSCGFGYSHLGAKYRNPREWFDSRLEEIALFIRTLKDDDGKFIPIIIRPLHECDDDWPWWGIGSVSKDDYISFFRYIVDQLRKKTASNSIIFAYSPDRFWTSMGDGGENDFLARYPGDNYVDIIGYDDYSIGNLKNLEESLAITIEKMRLVSREAQKRHKVCGLFETGCKGKTDDFYECLYRCLCADGVKFSFVNTWGNANTVPKTKNGMRKWKHFLSLPNIVTATKKHN